MHDRLPSGVAPDFLSGGGEMGVLMRAHDWSSSPLGSSDDWPEGLKILVGVMLRSNQPMFIAWGPERTLLYNDAYAEILARKHPTALGCDFLRVWHEIRADLLPIVGQAYAGEPVHMNDITLIMERRGYPEEAHFSFSYTPVRNETGTVAGFFCPCTEITRQVFAERRQAFRIKLEEALRDHTDPRTLMAAAVEMLGQHLGANRVGYSEVQADGETIVFETCFAYGVEPLIGTLSLSEFGPDRIARQRGGQTEVCDDVAADPAQVHATWAAIETRAFVSVPLIRDGRFMATLYVNFREPHRWTPEEVALIDDVAARTWAAVERARAEERLRESEARYRTLFTAAERQAAELRAVLESMPDGVYIGTVEGITLANQPALDQLGFATPEELNRHVGTLAEEIQTRDVGTGALIAIEDQAFTRAFRGERVVQDVRVRHRLSGEERVVRCAAAPVVIDGQVIGAVAVNTDVTAAKRAEEDLRESEGRFRALVTAGSYSVYRMSPDWTEMRQLDGRGFLPNTERPSEAWLGAYLHPDDHPHVMAAIQEAIRTNSLFELEHRVRRADGTLGWTHSRAVPILDGDGAIIEWFGAASDVTGRRQAEEARERLTRQLAEERSRLKILIDSLPVGVALVERDGTTLLSNPAFRRYRPDGAIPSRATDDLEQWIAYDDQGGPVPKSQYPGARALRGELVAGIEFLHRSPEGQESWTRVSGIPIKDADGHVNGALSVIVDIDEIKRSEEHQRLLINELNHRVKNTLATVQSIATQTLRNAPTAGEARDALEGRLLALARAHDVLTRENWEGAELREIVAQAVEPYNSRGEDRLHLSGPKARLPPRMALALSMVLQELATNAVKYGALFNTTGEIRITWKVEGKAPARLHLRWEESGGPPVQAPTRRGFGTRLIERSLAHDLDGDVRVEFAPTGVTCTVDAPIA